MGNSMRYGLPYQGSKNSIAEWVVEQLPSAETFVDLFCGGGAITHRALIEGRWRNYIMNDITDTPKFFMDAINGKYTVENQKEWISREDFGRNRKDEPYIKLCWSFGNNGENYLYSKEVEPWKKALHYARQLNDTSLFAEFGIQTDGSCKDIIKHHDEYKEKYILWYCKNVLKSKEEYEKLRDDLQGKIERNSEQLRQYLINARDKAGLKSSDIDKHLGTNGMSRHYFGCSQWEFPTRENYIKMQEIMPELSQSYEEIYGLHDLLQSLQSLQNLQSLQSLQRLESLERLQSLQRLQNLERLESLQSLQGDYQSVPIPQKSIIYCDIPYKDTDCGHYDGFDHERFYKWARQQDNIYISEYSMPEDFIPYAWIDKQSLMATNNGKTAREMIFTNQRTYDHLSELDKERIACNFAEQITIFDLLDDRK